jgi:hypothetical protein
VLRFAPCWLPAQSRPARIYYDAAFIFQHGEAADDYLFAHVAMDAVIKGYDTAKWIAAATLDRYLQKMDKPSVVGSKAANGGQGKTGQRTWPGT